MGFPFVRVVAAGLWAGLCTACPDPACPASAQGTACRDAGSGTAYSCCSGACIDLESDTANCGTCGVNCGGGGFCSAGACLPIPDCPTFPRFSPCPLPNGTVGWCCNSVCAPVEDAGTCQ